jgi:hypothetical protein
MFNTRARIPGHPDANDAAKRALLYDKAMEIIDDTEKRTLNAAESAWSAGEGAARHVGVEKAPPNVTEEPAGVMDS